MARIGSLLTAVVIIAVASLAATDPAGEPQAAPTPTGGVASTEGAPAAAWNQPIGAVTTDGRVLVHAEPTDQSAVVAQLPEGILLPVIEIRDGFVGVWTPCQEPGWIHHTGLRPHATSGPRPTTLEDATILLDPGHGGQLPGATGQGGLTEKVINLDLAWRVAEELGVARVFLTRNGDYTAGLAYRTELANRLGAHAFVSIHHNADPDGTSEGPGSETYFQQNSIESKRLGGLLYEEVVEALGGHDIAWVADNDAGAKSRPRPDGQDIYGILRMSKVPTVLAENLFISNPPEEQLLRRPDVREGLAEAIARGITRFIETDDPGSGYVESRPTVGASSGALPGECQDPR